MYREKHLKSIEINKVRVDHLKPYLGGVTPYTLTISKSLIKQTDLDTHNTFEISANEKHFPVMT